MKCLKAKKLIPLDVEGDLAENQAGALRDHLAACAACAGFAQEMRESQGVLKSLRLEVLGDAALYRSRRTALERLECQQSRQARAGSEV